MTKAQIRSGRRAIRRRILESQQAGVGIAELARRTGLTRQTLYVLRREERDPCLWTAIALADGLGIGLQDLISEERAA